MKFIILLILLTLTLASSVIVEKKTTEKKIEAETKVKTFFLIEPLTKMLFGSHSHPHISIASARSARLDQVPSALISKKHHR